MRLEHRIREYTENSISGGDAMKSKPERIVRHGHQAALVFTVSMIAALVVGCGASKEMGDEQSEGEMSVTGRLEYRIDSLANENRRMRQQLEAVATENRNLTARAADLETKLREAKAAPPPPPPAAKTTPAPAQTMDMTGRYSNALAEYRKRNFAAAIKQFESLLSDGIREDLADNCHYWIGESNYGMGKYQEAIGHFEHVFGFKHTEKRDDAQLMIGNSYAAMGNKKAAREAYNKLISSYPASTFVRKAQEKLGRLN